MTIHMDRKSLLADLQIVEKILNVGGNINSGLFWIKRDLDQTKMICFGGIEYIELSMDGYSEADGSFELCLNFAGFNHFVKNLKTEKIDIKLLDDGKIKLSGPGKSSEWKIVLGDRKAPGRPANFDASKGFLGIDLGQILEGINAIKFSVCKDQTTAPLTSIYVSVAPKGLVLYSTDRSRVSRYRIRKDYDMQEELRIPSFAFNAVDKLSKYSSSSRILNDKSYFVLSPEDDRYFYFCPQDGFGKPYPNVGQFFKATKIFTAEFLTKDLQDNLALIQVTGEPVVMNASFSNDTITVTGEDASAIFQAVIDIEVSVPLEEELFLKLDTRMFSEALSMIKSEKAEISIISMPSANSVLMLYLKDGAFDYVLAPRV